MPPSTNHGADAPPCMQKTRIIERTILNFTPSWFATTMGTGIVSSILHELPYQFHGLHTIANAVFVFNIVLFITCFIISILRYTLWPKVWSAMLLHPQQSLFLGTFTMGAATIINMIVLSCVPVWGSRFVTLAWVLWWIDAALALSICCGTSFVIFTRHEQTPTSITGVWFFPLVTTIVASATGALVANVLPPEHARLTIIVCYILWGTGMLPATLLMALFMQRLALYKVPPASLIVSVFIPVGPCGQSAYALLRLAFVINKLADSGNGFRFTGLTAEQNVMVAKAIYGGSIFVALPIWGLGLWWLILATCIILDIRFSSIYRTPTSSDAVDATASTPMKFNLGWWAFTFPIGTLTMATYELALVFDSTAFRVIGMVLGLTVVLLWVMVTVLTAKEAVVGNGQLFYAPCLSTWSGEAPPGRLLRGLKRDNESNGGQRTVVGEENGMV